MGTKKSLLRKNVIGCLVALTIIGQSSVGVAAETIDYRQTVDALGTYNSEYCGIYNSQTDKIVGLYVTENKVKIVNSGESRWIDAKGILSDGSIIDLNQEAEWLSDNSNIVYADQGRLLALAAGETKVKVWYGDYKAVINVTVQNDQDIASIVERLNKKTPMARNASATSIAKQMVEYKWTPTKNVRGWRNKITFSANTTYTGIPYSQTAYQVDKSGFASAMNKSEFYDNYSRTLNGESIIMPKYGNDCSGFVSFCWGISRQTTASFLSGLRNGTYNKVGTYDISNPTIADLKAAYKSLAPGNAVVKSGHTFLIASNDKTNKKVYVYEQTPYNARYTSWTYSDLANAKYLPFKK